MASTLGDLLFPPVSENGIGTARAATVATDSSFGGATQPTEAQGVIEILLSSVEQGVARAIASTGFGKSIIQTTAADQTNKFFARYGWIAIIGLVALLLFILVKKG